MIPIEPQIAPGESALDQRRIGADHAAARPARPGKVRGQDRRRVEEAEVEPGVDVDHVAARGEVGEVIALLSEGGLQQPQAVEAVLRQHAPGAQVAEPLAPAVDRPLRIEGELGADDLVAVEQHEPRVRALDLPRARRPRAPSGRPTHASSGWRAGTRPPGAGRRRRSAPREPRSRPSPPSFHRPQGASTQDVVDRPLRGEDPLDQAHRVRPASRCCAPGSNRPAGSFRESLVYARLVAVLSQRPQHPAVVGAERAGGLGHRATDHALEHASRVDQLLGELGVIELAARDGGACRGSRPPSRRRPARGRRPRPESRRSPSLPATTKKVAVRLRRRSWGSACSTSEALPSSKVSRTVGAPDDRIEHHLELVGIEPQLVLASLQGPARLADSVEGEVDRPLGHAGQ